VAVMLLVALFLFGFTVSAGWLGERMPGSVENRTPMKSVALGGAILVAVGLVPWIGTSVLILAAAISAGASPPPPLRALRGGLPPGAAGRLRSGKGGGEGAGRSSLS